jgi:hypothetical protein
MIIKKDKIVEIIFTRHLEKGRWQGQPNQGTMQACSELSQ